MGCLYLGAVFYSLLISSISSILQSANIASQQFEKTSLQIDDYMRTNKLPSALREKVKEHFNLQFTDGKMFNEKQLFSRMSPFLQREIQQFNCRVILQNVPMFSRIENKSFAEDICLSLVPSCVQENEIIIKEDSPGVELFYIENGIVDIFLPRTKEDSIYLSIGDGCYFGDVSVLLNCKRTASARASTKCYLYKLNREKLIESLENYPEIANKMNSVAMARRRRVQNYLAPLKFPLMPKDVIDTEDRETALFAKNTEVPANHDAFTNSLNSQRTAMRGGAALGADMLDPVMENYVDNLNRMTAQTV